MGIAADARQRWREGRVGTVPLASPRGVLALILFFSGSLAVIGYPLVLLVALLVSGHSPEPVEIDREVLVVNLLFNAVGLLFMPVLAIVVSNPGRPGAVAARLALRVTARTPVHAAIGAGVTLAAMLALGAALYGLGEAGVYHAEESELVPQIQKLLTLPLVFAIPLIAAVTEEVFFRGILQPRVGLWASSLLFGLVHIGYGTILQVVAPILLGLLFGLLFLRTRSLWAPIAAHFTFDFVELLILFLER